MTTIVAELTTASPPPSAWAAQPLSIGEIDAHPDAGRIWATIKAITDWAEDQHDSGYDLAASEREGWADEARSEARTDARTDVRFAIDRITRRVGTSAATIEALKEIGEVL